MSGRHEIGDVRQSDGPSGPRNCAGLHEIVEISDRANGPTDLSTLLSGATSGELQQLAASRQPDFHVDDVTLLPVIPHPRKVLCVGLNFLGHIRETGRPIPAYPPIFTRFADTLIGHGQDAVVPAVSSQFDYEGELAVVIGRPARRVKAWNASSVVAGYSCFNDFSVRDWQFHTSQYTPGKNFPSTGALGPYLTTPDEAGPVAEMELVTRVNGEVRQSSPMSDLLFVVEDLIEYITSWTTLLPGDVIATGTPSGVASAQVPPRWLRSGDECTVEINHLGVLRNPVRSEPQSGSEGTVRD